MRVLVLVFTLVATTVAFANPKQAAVHARQGKAYFDAKQYDQAIVEFKKSYDLDKKPVTLFKIASAYYQAGDYQSAIDYYGKYLSEDPNGPFAKEALEFSTVANKALADAKAKADADAKAKADADAKAKADADAKAKAETAEGHLKQAQAFVVAGAWVSAGDEYMKAAEASGDPELLIEAGSAYMKQFEYAKARAAYEAYLVKVPSGTRSDGIRATVAQIVIAIEAAAKLKKDEAARVEEAKYLASPKPWFEAAISLAPGAKLRGDNPFLLALRAEAALRFGRRVNFGAYIEYARLSTSGSCGTDLPGPTPATDFDVGPRNVFSSCAYVMPGLQLYVHILPRKKIDPYVGFTPGFRFGSVSYTTHFNGMEQSNSQTLKGIVLGARAGVTYHLSQEVNAWTVGGFVEAAYQLIGDEEGPDTLATGPTSFLTVFVGGRTTVTF